MKLYKCILIDPYLFIINGVDPNVIGNLLIFEYSYILLLIIKPIFSFV